MTNGGADAVVTATVNTAISPTSAATYATDGSTNASTTATTKKQSSAYVQYLLSYEGMVRHQDLEYDATLVRMTNIFKRVQSLGKKDDDEDDDDDDDDYEKEEEDDDGETTTIPEGMLTYLQMRRCLSRIGVKWKNRSSSSSDDVTDYNNTNNDDDDDVSVLSFNSSSTSGRSNGGLPSASAAAVSATDKKKKKYDAIIATDSQLILLLITLVETEEKYRAAMAVTTTTTMTITNKNSTTKRKRQLERGLFLPEFVQAYKLIIAGMQCLKSVVPNPDDDYDEPTSTTSSSEDLIHRLKERTLGLMRPFGPDSSLYNYNNKSNRKSNLSNGEIIKKVIRAKDEVLTKIVEEHESEMDALATSVVELRNRERKTRDLSKKRRKRLRYTAGLLFVLSITAGIIAEVRRRDFLTREIADAGREAERVRDAQSIARLEAERDELEKKLGVITGKMRYQSDRNDGVEVRLADVQKEIDNVATKGRNVKREMERCLATHEELEEDLKGEGRKKDGVDEELAWCENRLRSRERDLNELKHIRDNDKDAESGKNVVAVVAKSSTMTIEGSDHHSGVDEALMHKPVQLEMKYNESIRKSVFLRQTYSAIAGFAVSVALRGLAPMVLKLFAPKVAARAVVPPPPLLPKTRDAEMILVDGIFGSSVAFLLVQAVLTFLSPL